MPCRHSKIQNLIMLIRIHILPCQQALTLNDFFIIKPLTLSVVLNSIKFVHLEKREKLYTQNIVLSMFRDICTWKYICSWKNNWWIRKAMDLRENGQEYIWKFDGGNRSENVVTEIQTQKLTWRKAECNNIC